MKETRLIMGMPIEIEIVDNGAGKVLEAAFAYLVSVDERFSTYKEESEISRINRGSNPRRRLSRAGAIHPQTLIAFPAVARNYIATMAFLRPDRIRRQAQAGGIRAATYTKLKKECRR